MVQLRNYGRGLLLCGAGWLMACVAQPAAAQAPAELTDLSATITASAFVTRGEPINVSLRVHNNGPNEAAFISARLELGAGLTIASMKLSGGSTTPAPGGLGTCLQAGNVLSCSLPQLPSGQSFTFDVVTAATTARGSFSHIAVVQSSGTDLVLSNNSAGTATTVTEASQDFTRRGSGGGGSTSLFMLAALLILSGLRVGANKFQRATRRPLF